MLKSLLIVGLGSFIGGVLRYALSVYIKNNCSQGFPWGTLLVNLMGCLVMGLILALFRENGSTGNMWCLLLTTGLCGGFTTFSTFSCESFQMLQSGDFVTLAFYLASSLIGGILLMGLGYWLVR